MKAFRKVGGLGDLERVRSVSARLEERLSELGHRGGPGELGGLSLEELQDLSKVVGLADFMLAKYADRKEMRDILKGFVGIISGTAGSLAEIDDEVAELILEAEDSIGRVKGIHSRISAKSEVSRPYHDGPEFDAGQTSVAGIRGAAGSWG